MKWTMAGGIRRAWRRLGAGFSAHGMVPTTAIAHCATTLLSELIRITPHFLYRNQVEALSAATITGKPDPPEFHPKFPVDIARHRNIRNQKIN
jgi:hypothetical protein